jgi:hypothetical protein
MIDDPKDAPNPSAPNPGDIKTFPDGVTRGYTVITIDDDDVILNAPQGGYWTRTCDEDPVDDPPPPVWVVIKAKFPHRCPRCRSPAYISLFSIECSKPACGAEIAK